MDGIPLVVIVIGILACPEAFKLLKDSKNEIAKKKFPGSKNNLNALCRRFGISLENREKHGALTDSFLLLQVYNELLGGKQKTLSLKLEPNKNQLKKFIEV